MIFYDDYVVSKLAECLQLCPDLVSLGRKLAGS